MSALEKKMFDYTYMYINTYKLNIEKLRFQADVLGPGNDYTCIEIPNGLFMLTVQCDTAYD